MLGFGVLFWLGSLSSVNTCYLIRFFLSFRKISWNIDSESRDHGLPLYVKLGVIIQKMVDTEIHGVLFTCHPISNDPRVLSVTYSFKEHATLDNVPSVTILVDKSNFSVIETVYNSMNTNNRGKHLHI